MRERPQQIFAGSVLVNRNPNLAQSFKEGALLDSVEACCVPMTPVSFFTITVKRGFSQTKLIEDRRQLEQAWMRSTTAELHLSSAPSDYRNDGEPFSRAILSRYFLPYKRGSQDNFLQHARLYRSVDSDSIRAFLDGLKEVLRLLESPSGYVHVSSDDGLTMSELGFQGIMGRRPTTIPSSEASLTSGEHAGSLHYQHPEDTNDRVEQLAQVRSLVGARLRGTYWGTFLGREMVDELGGADRVRREAPVHLVEPFGDGALYLQLTPEPEPITTPAMQTGLLALERFLQPVLVPLPPYWATRAAKAAQQAAESGGTATPA